MKKLVFFLIPLIVSIPAFAQDKSLFTENFSLVKYSGNFNLNTASSVNNLFHTEEECHYKQYLAFQTPKFHQFSELIYFSRDSVIERNKQSREKPPLRGGRIAGEVLLGGTLGFFVGGGLALVGYHIGGYDTDTGRAVALVVGTIGVTFGSSLGVYLIGNIGNETGSYWSTFSGSAVGVATSFFLFFVLRGESENTMKRIFFTLPAVGGVIAFNKTRRYQTPPTYGTSFINFSDGKMNFAFPKIYFRPNPSVKGDLIQTINLLEVIF